MDYQTSSQTPIKLLFPKINHIISDEKFKFLWLKYVEAFDLSIHCARCLVGRYSKHIPYGATNGVHIVNKYLNEHRGRYYYLCGVTQPYRYNDNLHIAFEYADGEILRYTDNHTTVEIENARLIPITRQENYSKHQFGHIEAYNTCRNWRFAYQETYKIK